MKTAICAIIKDEHLFLKEWIDWHLGLGFDAIHLFEDKGSESHEEIVKEYDNVFLRRYETDKELQAVISPEYGNSRQVRLYQWFCKEMAKDIDWVAFIDVDEYVLFEEGWNLISFCQMFKDVPAVHLYWKMKGASGHITRPSCGIMEAYTEDAPFIKTDEVEWNCKSFVNLKKSMGMRTCHHAVGGVRTDGTEGTEPVYIKAWLNHYFSKSWEDWCDRIYKRGDVYKGHRTLADFFEANPSMEHLREELIASVAERIPNGTHWVDKKRGLVAGGNMKKIQSLNMSINQIIRFDYQEAMLTSYYKVSDEYCVTAIPKCACSTTALQTLHYNGLISVEDCEKEKYKHIHKLHSMARKVNHNVDFNSLIKVQIIRDPLERFISAYHTLNYSDTNWNCFLYEKAKDIMKDDRHFAPQYLYSKHPDIYVYIKDYEKFCTEHGIEYLPANINNKPEYLNFKITEDDKEYIKELYYKDYDFLEHIKNTGKIWTY